jgi:hypothetical protein
MKLTPFLKTGYLVAALAALPLLASAKGLNASQSAEATERLESVRDGARDVAVLADRYYAMAQTASFDWQAQAAQLTYLKTSVNDLAVNLKNLNALRSSLPTSQQGKELDRAVELTRQVVESTTTAIRFVNEHPRALWQTGYRKNADTLDTRSGQLSQLLDNYTGYVHSLDKQARLERALGE